MNSRILSRALRLAMACVMAMPASPAFAQSTTYFLKITSSKLFTTTDRWSMPNGQQYIDLQIVTTPNSGYPVLSYGATGYTSYFPVSNSDCNAAGHNELYMYGVPPTMKAVAAWSGEVVGTLTITPPATASNTVRLPGVPGRQAQYGIGLKFADRTIINSLSHHQGCPGIAGPWSLIYAGGGVSSTTYVAASACGTGPVHTGVSAGTIYYPIYSSGCSGNVQGQASLYQDYLIGY